MSDTDIYNQAAKKVSDAVSAALVEFQHALEVQRLERDRAVKRADVNQRKYEMVNEDLQQLREAYDRQVNSSNVLFAGLGSVRKQVILLDAELQRMREIDRLVKEASGGRWHPHYTSTYCIHGDHESCRKTCKTCQAPCRCRADDCPCNSLASQVMDLVEEMDAVPIPPDAQPIP